VSWSGGGLNLGGVAQRRKQVEEERREKGHNREVYLEGCYCTPRKNTGRKSQITTTGGKGEKRERMRNSGESGGKGGTGGGKRDVTFSYLDALIIGGKHEAGNIRRGGRTRHQEDKGGGGGVGPPPQNGGGCQT